MMGGGEGRTKAHVENTCAQAVLKDASENGYCATLKTTRREHCTKEYVSKPLVPMVSVTRVSQAKGEEQEKREAKRR